MRKKFVCEFLNVSRPFQANWAWRGASSRGLSLRAKGLELSIQYRSVVQIPANIKQLDRVFKTGC
jgi:hypothetical protein